MSRLEELIAEFYLDGMEHVAWEQVLREKIAKITAKIEVD